MEPLRIVKNFGGGGNPSLGLDLTRFWSVEESEKKNKPSFFSAFTLAEMMVVMLILSIVLAAMAPVMTTRNKPNNSSPWQYQANNRSNAWFGAGSGQHAMIGQNSYGADDTIAKLLITVGDDTTNFLAFKRNNANIGRLFIGGTNLLLGNLASGTLGDGSVGVGRSIQASGTNAIVFGRLSQATGEGAMAIGDTSIASGSYSLAIASGRATASSAMAIGVGSEGSEIGSMAIGNNSKASSVYAAAFGHTAKAEGLNSVAVGSSVTATEQNSIAIGSNANVTLALDTATEKVTSNSAIAIGRNSVAKYLGSIALGADSIANGYQTKVADIADIPSIAIGSGAKAESTGTIAIGADTTSNVPRSIVIGAGASVGAVGEKEYAGRKVNSASIAIGPNSYAEGKYNQDYDSISRENSIAIGDQAKAVAGGIAIGSIYQSGTTSGSNSSSTTTAGNGSVAVGTGTNATGIGAVAVGRQANASGYHSIAIGQNACSNVTGSNKICIGTNSGPITDTNANGEPEGKWKTDGVERIFIGSRSAQNGGAAVLEVHNGEEDVNFWIDQKKSSSVVINGNLLVKGQVLLPDVPHGPANGGDNKSFRYYDGTHSGCDGAECEFRWREDYSRGNVIDFYGRFGGTHGSDRRLKYVGKENTSGLDKIRQLKIFNYVYKKDTTKTPHVGVIAQDLQKIFPNAVKKGADGFLTIRMEDMFYAVINAIKELDSRMTALEKENKDLKAQLAAQSKRLDRLEAKVK